MSYYYSTSKDTCEDDLIGIKETITQGIVDSMGALVNGNDVGAVKTDDLKAEGFYIVKFTSIPFTLQENMEMNKQLIKKVSLVCVAEYTSPAQRGSL
eukprot:7438661-Ditylum_brightwellii.AAC.1